MPKSSNRVYTGTIDEKPEEVVARITQHLAERFPNQSVAQTLADLPADERRAWFDSLSLNEQSALEYEWQFWARPNQREPKDLYKIWIILAGRGFGKSKAAAETVRKWIESG